MLVGYSIWHGGYSLGMSSSLEKSFMETGGAFGGGKRASHCWLGGAGLQNTERSHSAAAWEESG